MFKIAKEPTFQHTVKVRVPVDGGFEDQSLKVTFRVLPNGQFSNAGGVEGQIEDMRKAIVSMDDLVDGENNPVPFSDELKEQLIAVSYVRLALVQAYIDAVAGARTGN